MSEVIKGSRLAKNIREKVGKRIEKLGHPPGLAAVLVGEDAASHLYVKLKEKAAKEAGIYFEKKIFEANISEGKLIKEIKKLNAREDIHGILLQLPLPNQNEDAVIEEIKWQKDVDGFHRKNRKRLADGEPSLVPPVALAIVRLIQETHQPLRGKTAVIVGNNEIFAEPIERLLEESGVAVQFIQRDESAIATKTRAADIVIVAVGVPNFITKDMVKAGGIIIDVGTNKVNGKLVGDVSPDVMGHTGFVSPVPGGVGPLTVAYLLMNVLKASTEILDNK